jgi:hypothetical protein
MTSMEGYMVQAIVVCVFIFILFFWSWRLKAKYQRQAIDHVLGEFVTMQGTGYSQLLRVEGGLVILEPDEKRGISGKSFPVAERASYDVDYPEGFWCPRFLKCKINKIVFREFDVEPASNLYSEEPVMQPSVLYNIRRERTTEIGARIAQIEARERGVDTTTRKKFKFGGMTMWLVLLGMAVLIGLIIYIFNLSADNTMMRNALGIP